MTNQNKYSDIFSYIDLMISTSTGNIGPKRWADLKKNLENRIYDNDLYLTEKEAEGILINSQMNKKISKTQIPKDLLDIIDDATGYVDEESEILSIPPHKISIDKEKPSATDHSVADMALKESKIRLNEVLTEAVIFLLDWAKEYRENLDK